MTIYSLSPQSLSQPTAHQIALRFSAAFPFGLVQRRTFAEQNRALRAKPTPKKVTRKHGKPQGLMLPTLSRRYPSQEGAFLRVALTKALGLKPMPMATLLSLLPKKTLTTVKRVETLRVEQGNLQKQLTGKQTEAKQATEQAQAATKTAAQWLDITSDFRQITRLDDAIGDLNRRKGLTSDEQERLRLQTAITATQATLTATKTRLAEQLAEMKTLVKKPEAATNSTPPASATEATTNSTPPASATETTTNSIPPASATETTTNSTPPASATETTPVSAEKTAPIEPEPIRLIPLTAAEIDQKLTTEGASFQATADLGFQTAFELAKSAREKAGTATRDFEFTQAHLAQLRESERQETDRVRQVTGLLGALIPRLSIPIQQALSLTGLDLSKLPAWARNTDESSRLDRVFAVRRHGKRAGAKPIPHAMGLSDIMAEERRLSWLNEAHIAAKELGAKPIASNATVDELFEERKRLRLLKEANQRLGGTLSNLAQLERSFAETLGPIIVANSSGKATLSPQWIEEGSGLDPNLPLKELQELLTHLHPTARA